MFNPSLTRIAKHLRGRLKVAGIKAKCSAYVSCGVQYIRISPPAHDVQFTEDEQRQILTIAKVNRLTLARGMEIDENQMTYANGGHFVLPWEVQ
jgi:hypothetical protein